MGWNMEEEKTTKKGMDTPLKVLLAIMVCLITIIILICILIFYIQKTSYRLYLNGKEYQQNSDSLVKEIDGMTYIQIKEFAKLVGYDYHKGEFKNFTIEEDKCYVQNQEETASFFLNDNKVCKLPVNKITEDYRTYSTENTVKEINGEMYATIDAIRLAFNVQIANSEKSLQVFTLNYLVAYYDLKAISWGYTGIKDQTFENTKSILYDCLIVKKKDGLYKIIDTQNTKEIISDKYNSIEFIENTREFFVTNSLGKVGIINLDGTTKIDPEYDSIEVLDKKSNLYLIKEAQKYGVVKSGNITIIYPEYDSIGLKIDSYPYQESKYLLLDTLIPVCKGGKYGAFDKEGKLVLKLEYDGLGCNKKQVDIAGIKRDVTPVLTIEECKGIVVQKEGKYGLRNIEGKSLVSISLDNIYSVEDEEDNITYYMLYNGEELNIIEELIKANVIEKEPTNNIEENNIVENNIGDNNIISSELDNNGITEDTINSIDNTNTTDNLNTINTVQ